MEGLLSTGPTPSSFNSNVRQNQQIPVITSNLRDPTKTLCVPPRMLRKVNINENVNESAAMPVVAGANCRSIEPKINSEKNENESIDLLMLIKVWINWRIFSLTTSQSRKLIPKADLE